MPRNYDMKVPNVIRLKCGVTYYKFLGRHCAKKEYITDAYGTAKESNVQKKSTQNSSTNN